MIISIDTSLDLFFSHTFSNKVKHRTTNTSLKSFAVEAWGATSQRFRKGGKIFCFIIFFGLHIILLTIEGIKSS